MISPAALIAGLVLASPTLWAALIEGTMPAGVAMQRLVVILFGTALAWSAVQLLLGGFARANAEQAKAAARSNAAATLSSVSAAEASRTGELRQPGAPAGRRATD